MVKNNPTQLAMNNSNTQLLQQLQFFPVYLQKKAYSPLFSLLMEAISRYHNNEAQAFKQQELDKPLQNAPHFRAQAQKSQAYWQQCRSELDFVLQALFKLLQQADFVLTEAQSQQLMNVHWFVGGMLGSSSFSHSDEAYLYFKQQLNARLTQPKPAPAAEIQNLLAKMLFSYAGTSRQSINLENAWQLNRTLTLHFILSLCGSPFTQNAWVQTKLKQGFAFMIQKMQQETIDLAEIPGAKLNSFYFNCAYYYQHDNYLARRLMNQIIQSKINETLLPLCTPSPLITITQKLIQQGHQLDFPQFILLMFHQAFFPQIKDEILTLIKNRADRSTKSAADFSAIFFSNNSASPFHFTFVTIMDLLTTDSVFFRTHSRFIANIKWVLNDLFFTYIEKLFLYFLQYSQEISLNDERFFRFIQKEKLILEPEISIIKQLALPSDSQLFNQYLGFSFSEKDIALLKTRLTQVENRFQVHRAGIVLNKGKLPTQTAEMKRTICVDPLSLFDEILECGQEVLFDKLQAAYHFCHQLKHAHKKHITLNYHLSIGLSPASWILANTRLSDIQVMTTGQPCTSAQTQIDYLWAEESFTSPQTEKWVAEQLIRLPNALMPLTLPLEYQVNYLAQQSRKQPQGQDFQTLAEAITHKMTIWITQNREKIDRTFASRHNRSANLTGTFDQTQPTANAQMMGGNQFAEMMKEVTDALNQNAMQNNETNIIRIGIVGFTSKLNPPFLLLLHEIQQKALAFHINIQFIFIINKINDLTYGFFLRDLTQWLLPDSFFIYPGLPYHQYLNNLKSIDFAISPFPFGNDNSAVDLLYDGILSLSQQRDDMASRTDTARTTAVGIPTELISDTTLTSLVDKALFFATHSAELKQLKTAFIKEMRLLRLMV